MPRRGTGFTQQELETLLDAIEKYIPVGMNEWERVESYHASRYPMEERTKESLKRKFASLYRKKIKTGDPNCPPEVRRAKNLLEAIKNKTDLTSAEGDPFSDDDDEYESAEEGVEDNIAGDEFPGVALNLSNDDPSERSDDELGEPIAAPTPSVVNHNTNNTIAQPDRTNPIRPNSVPPLRPSTTSTSSSTTVNPATGASTSGNRSVRTDSTVQSTPVISKGSRSKKQKSGDDDDVSFGKYMQIMFQQRDLDREEMRQRMEMEDIRRKERMEMEEMRRKERMEMQEMRRIEEYQIRREEAREAKEAREAQQQMMNMFMMSMLSNTMHRPPGGYSSYPGVSSGIPLSNMFPSTPMGFPPSLHSHLRTNNTPIPPTASSTTAGTSGGGGDVSGSRNLSSDINNSTTTTGTKE